MRFTEVLDRAVYPVGTLIRRAFEREGLGDPDRLAVESPRGLLNALSKLYNDERTAKLFLYLAAIVLAARGASIAAEEWLQAFETDDAACVRSWLERLDSLI